MHGAAAHIHPAQSLNCHLDAPGQEPVQHRQKWTLRYFSTKSFDARDGGPGHRGVGVAQADGVRAAGNLSASCSLFPGAGLVTLTSGADQ